jgi:hypothetical protein
MKYSQWIGIAAAIVLVVACFMPWAYFPDIDKEFTGFFSERNAYGRPGKLLVSFSVIAVILFLIPRIWAKRLNLFIGALTFAFALRNFLLFIACYRGTCPQVRPALYLVLICPMIITVMAALPDDLSVKKKG